jgi:dTDP-4-dehydrorhamnose reductase
MNQTILLTGVHGQVGAALSRGFDALSASHPMCLSKVVKLTRAELDLRNVDAIRQIIQTVKPTIIINPAAYTAVDKAESEPDLAFAINATAPRILAEEAAKLQAKLIHFSTDSVYDGKKTTPYIESDETNPLSVYGKTKLAGEAAIRLVSGQHLIFRTSWVYGNDGHNFMKTILRLSQSRESLDIVADQYGAPTSSESIADATIATLQNWQQQSGVYHLVNEGETTWHGFAKEIVLQYFALTKTPQLKVIPNAISPISTAEYPLPASRPANSRLNTEKLRNDFGVELCVWQKALSFVLERLPNT